MNSSPTQDGLDNIDTFQSSQKIYVAGKYSDVASINHVQTLLVQMGHTITHDWTEYTDLPKQMCADLDIKGVQECDILFVLMLDAKYSYRGTWTEIGCAIGLGKRIIIVCPDDGDYECYTNCFFHHSSIQHVKTIEQGFHLLTTPIN